MKICNKILTSISGTSNKVKAKINYVSSINNIDLGYESYGLMICFMCFGEKTTLITELGRLIQLIHCLIE